MKVTSNTPIIITGSNGLPDDYFSPASGATRRAKAASRQKSRAQKKAKGEDVWSKTKRGLQSIAESGAIDALLRGQPTQTAPAYVPEQMPYVAPVDNSKPPMKKGVKIAIGVTIVAVVGVAIWYFGFRKKK